MTLKVTCPTCKASSHWTQENQSKPFCSERCKLIDLGEWADERYSIASATPHINLESFQVNEESIEDFFKN